tara:strand:+ start:7212 stop:7688 length:477 start_codon:yes stop_codon:yes gene_type:complete
MGGLLSTSSSESSIIDFISSVQKDGFKLQLPAFKIEPTTATPDNSSLSIIQQWFVLMILTFITYVLFVNRYTISSYIKNIDSEQFKSDFNDFKTGAVSKLSSTGNFVKTNIIDEIAEGTKNVAKNSYLAAKDEVTSIAKDSFSFVKGELLGNKDENKN